MQSCMTYENLQGRGYKKKSEYKRPHRPHCRSGVDLPQTQTLKARKLNLRAFFVVPESLCCKVH